MCDESVSSLKTAVASLSVAVPEAPSNPEHVFEENNKVVVKCSHSRKFHGKERKFRAQLIRNEFVIKNLEEEKECKFEFSELRYLTTYHVKVCVALLSNTTLIFFSILWLINILICIFS